MSQTFTITGVEWGYQDPPEAIELGARPGRPVKVVKIIHAHCNQCYADMKLTRSHRSPEPGRFHRVFEVVYIVCSACGVESTVPMAEINGVIGS